LGVYLLIIYRNFTDPVGHTSPGAIAFTCHGVFSVARYVGIVLATLLLHRKFTNPTTAPGYITLPASPLEKFVTLLADYAAVLLGIRVLEFLCYEATMGLGACLFPDLYWSLPFFDSSENIEELLRELTVMSIRLDSDALGLDNVRMATDVCATSLWLATLLYFICLNFHFRRNGILKSCLFLVLTYIVLLFILVPMVGLWLNDYLTDVNRMDDARFRNEVAPQVYSVMHTTYILMWCTPLLPIGVAARLYRLVSKKQIK
jgi:hypothetical protein